MFKSFKLLAVVITLFVSITGSCSEFGSNSEMTFNSIKASLWYSGTYKLPKLDNKKKEEVTKTQKEMPEELVVAIKKLKNSLN